MGEGAQPGTPQKASPSIICRAPRPAENDSIPSLGRSDPMAGRAASRDPAEKPEQCNLPAAGSTEASVFGKFPTRFIAQLIINGFELTQAVAKDQKIPGGIGELHRSVESNSQRLAEALARPPGHISG